MHPQATPSVIVDLPTVKRNIARLAEYGINVYEIRPGIIATDMTAGVKERYDKLIGEGLTPRHSPIRLGRAGHG